MDKIIEAIILGIIQGFTEFLPISSSAHLAVVPWLFNWSEISASFDLALHIGTLLALIIFFFKDGINYVKSGIAVAILKLSKLFKKEKSLKIDEDKKISGNIFWYIVFATIPAGLLSLVLDKVSEKLIGDNASLKIILIAVASVIMGLLLYFIDKKCESKKDINEASFKDVMIIDISQALAAAFPGVSRSGVTITASRKFGFDRQSSAKLSFLLSIPIILAAVIVKVKDFDLTYPVAFFSGIIVSFIVGSIIIRQLFKYLKEGEYKVFAIYRVCFGIALVIAVLIRTFMA